MAAESFEAFQELIEFCSYVYIVILRSGCDPVCTGMFVIDYLYNVILNNALFAVS